ncbi:hypothetical protein [Pleomorphovibrio marinus]|uniref:hypothetical protein n=1 Tax=Pleomorphovibrio marinus TaxID=2164132 RepID=UPI000E0A8DDE|nr:hypothetical protein [Pleomorphovibrio marinus]
MRDIRVAVSKLKLAASKAVAMADTGNQFLADMMEGKGVVQKLFTDTELADKLSYSIERISESGNQAAGIVSQIDTLIDSLEAGEGTIGLLLKVPSFREELSNSRLNLVMSTERFNENLEAMRRNFLFRRLEKERGREPE